MNVLAIEASTRQASVAALRGGKCVFDESFVSERGQSSDFFVNLERALPGVTPLHRIAVGLGPGSYSGVRIAISTAIGLAFGTGAELVGVPSVLAFACAEKRYRVIGDARRGTFYFAEIAARSCVEGPALLTPAELEMRLAADPCAVFTSAELPRFPSALLAFPSARLLADLAVAENGIIARGKLEPIYLREPYITLPKASSNPVILSKAKDR